MKLFFSFVFLGLTSVLFSPARAQESAAKPSRTVLHAAKLLDVKTGRMLSDQAIVIEAGKIASVGPMSEVRRSSGDRTLELPNATVLPGLIDAHTHLTGDPRDIGYQSLGISVPRATLKGARNAYDLGGWLYCRAKCGR
jgi:imidazolonepropionase-like amidohydrolase